jgi:hypothetical protein
MDSSDCCIFCDSVCAWYTHNDVPSAHGSAFPEHSGQKGYVSNLEFYYRGTSMWPFTTKIKDLTEVRLVCYWCCSGVCW